MLTSSHANHIPPRDLLRGFWLLRTFLQTGSIALQMRSKRRKVRGHQAIAPFSGVGWIVDDRYPARVSSSDGSGNAIVCRVELGERGDSGGLEAVDRCSGSLTISP